MKIVTVVGARPQFIKAAAVSRVLRRRHTEILVHTGQHYDANMSDVFFDELGIPQPDINLAIGSGSHGAQTAVMLAGIETVLLRETPDWLLVYGDTNSTLAGALAAAKLHIPIVHVEAGLRSFNRAMPEEINRVLTDHISSLLLCPSATAIQNLAAEGIVRGVHDVGDVMADALNFAVARAQTLPSALDRLGVRRGAFLLLTVHRAENTDDPARFAAILAALSQLDEPVLFPVHPRTRRLLETAGHQLPPNVRSIEPLGYLEMVQIEASARMVLTDSGGIQKEAYWLGVPCVTLRNETEWVETVALGWNVLVGADTARIIAAVRAMHPPSDRPALYGDGHAADACVAALEQHHA